MIRFLIVRVSLIAITLLVVSAAIFAVTEVLPGDIAWQVLGQGATPENLAVVRERLDLNRPAYVRYFDWVIHAVRIRTTHRTEFRDRRVIAAAF